LGSDRTVGSSPFFCSTTQIKTLVRNHPSPPPAITSAGRTLRANSKAMVNIHRRLPVPRRDRTVAQR
jgi:hypothetical protein